MALNLNIIITFFIILTPKRMLKQTLSEKLKQLVSNSFDKNFRSAGPRPVIRRPVDHT